MNRGDYSRLIQKRNGYTAVLKQQGRVDLDADWIEDHEIAAHLRQTLTEDVIGPCGFPEIGGGFAISPYVRHFRTTDNVIRFELDLGIRHGRGYVDGILCELEERTPIPISGILVDSGELRRVNVPTLVVDGQEFQEGQLVEIFAEDPAMGTESAQIIDVDRAQRILTLDKDIGRFLGIVGFPPPGFALRRAHTYTSQPDYPNPPPLESGELPPPQSAFELAPRTDLVYLDVWQRHITAIEDPDILEVALGGPDTTTRVKTVCQVKVMKGVRAESCEDEIEGWPPPPSGGRLSTEVVPTPAAEDPCLIAPGAGYRGLENHLYRVEIHRGGDLGEAAFKWSRDNGSVVFPIEEFASDRQVRVKHLGRDQILRLRTDDWVEILDDGIEYRQDHIADGEVAGTMAQIVSIDEEDRLLTLDRDIPANIYHIVRHARVRRWDQTQGVDADGLLATAAGPIMLEDGIQVSFSGENIEVGDYWVFAARTATGDVERLTDEPPQGVKHHYCRLALVELGIDIRNEDGDFIDESELKTADCRPIFPPLTEVPSVSFGPAVTNTSWRNDRTLTLGEFNQGLTVEFSEPMEADTLSLDTFIVTLELAEQAPAGNFPYPGHRALIVQGTVDGSGETCRFRPDPQIRSQTLNQWLNRETELFKSIRRLRCRVVLKGNSILDERTKQHPLDGDVFARLSNETDPDFGRPFRDLVFPSGDGNKGGDFES